jgi:hypothetical protein
MTRTFVSRRGFLGGVALAGVAAGLRLQPAFAAEPARKVDVADPEIRDGLAAAIDKNLIPAASQRAYPGHFTVTADGAGYGSDATWPGLDSWQMAGAYLLLGKTQIALDYFDFVRASQRKDGNIPWAIFNGATRPDTTWLSGLKYPDGLFTYTPPKREGVPASARATREWIGMFGHWQPKATPLSNLGSTCHVLTASEIFAHTRDDAWLRERIESVESVAKWLLSRKTPGNGLIPGSGFYTELPPRHGWDGVSQCYVVHACRATAKLHAALGNADAAKQWNKDANELTAAFLRTFWQRDHFAEYVHFERGLVDSHGLSDTNWAAIAFGLASDENVKKLWPLLDAEKSMWAGGVPTQSVAKPLSYEPWEFHEKLAFGAPPLKDASAMGRVWYLEVEACKRVGATKRLVESTKLVCRAAKDGYWRERYALQRNGTILPNGAEKYCEYAAVLARTVLGNPGAFEATHP